MSYNLAGFIAPDEYSGESPGDLGFLACQGAVRVRIHVNNQPVFWQRAHFLGGGGVGDWEPEEELPPNTYSFPDRCDAIRFRAATPVAVLKKQEEEEPGKKFPQAFISCSCRVRRELGA